MTQTQSTSHIKSEKKKKRHSADKLYFFHEDNRDLWEGRSKQFANPDEVLYQIYDVEKPEENPEVFGRMLVVSGLVIIFGSGALWWLVSRVVSDALSNPDIFFLFCTVAYLLYGGSVFFLGSADELRRNDKYNHYSEHATRLLSDVIRHGECIIGHVEEVRNYSMIYFYYYDTQGNYHRATYTHPKKDTFNRISFGSRLALIQYNGRFVVL